MLLRKMIRASFYLTFLKSGGELLIKQSEGCQTPWVNLINILRAQLLHAQIPKAQKI